METVITTGGWFYMPTIELSTTKEYVSPLLLPFICITPLGYKTATSVAMLAAR
jgi:hypothetical protein